MFDLPELFRVENVQLHLFPLDPELVARGGLRAQHLHLGRGSADRIEITDGLQDGERVCRVAERRFFNGKKVVLSD